MKKFILSITSLCALLLFASAGANEFQLSDEHLKKIKLAEDHINQIRTMKSDFVQVSPYGRGAGTSISYGIVSISRPGKARWEYHKPNKQLIVINGNRLAYHDKELDQVSYTDVDGGLRELLTRENLDFLSGEYKIVDFSDGDEIMSIVLEQVKKGDGDFVSKEQLRLSFLKNPILFKRFNYRDVNGRITTVEFKNPEFGVAFDDETFVFKNPKLNKNPWDR